jgi:hypothetical protein
MSDSHDALAPAPADAPALSLFERALAVFTRPTHAWGGLREKAQWWFPTLLLTVVSAAITLALHQRALVPMMVEAWDQQVADGNMSPQQVDTVVAFMTGPLGMTLTALQQAIVIPFIVLLTGLVVWFGAGFVLGTGLKFRLALEVAAWSSLVTIPGYLLTAVLAWIRETMRGIHVGFGALLPALEEPTKFGIAVRSFLDAIGPLAIWFVAVGVIGAAALSGAPRKSVAWVLGVLYVAIALFMSAMAAMFAPGT